MMCDRPLDCDVFQSAESMIMCQALETSTQTHQHLYSAFGDLIDNPFEARASHIEIRKLDSELLDKWEDRSLAMSDDGTGFQDRAHLENAYDLGKSQGEGKGNEWNYGQGEKAGGLRVADTILKLSDRSGERRTSPSGPEIRMIAMLSRPMQKAAAAAQGKRDWTDGSIMRPCVEWRRSDPDSEWKLFNEDPVCLEQDEKSLLDILQHSPWTSTERIMKAFDQLSTGSNASSKQKFVTHLVLANIVDTLNFVGDRGKTPHDIEMTDCQPKNSWRAKLSLREYISLSHPKTQVVYTAATINLFGSLVVPTDFSASSAIFKKRVVELKHGEETTINKKKFKNKTRFDVRIGFVFDAKELAKETRQKNTNFIENHDAKSPEKGPPYQGICVLSRSRVIQMPTPVPTERSGGILKKFVKGVGALIIVTAPEDMKGAPCKTKFETGGAFDSEEHQLTVLVEKLADLLHQENMHQPITRVAPQAAAPPQNMSRQARGLHPLAPLPVYGRGTGQVDRNIRVSSTRPIPYSEDWVPKVGDRVEASYFGNPTIWYLGTIKTANKKRDLFTVAYDDDDEESGVKREMIRRPELPATPQKHAQSKKRKGQEQDTTRG